MWHVFFVALFGIFKAYEIKGATSQSENLANKRLIVFFFFFPVWRPSNHGEEHFLPVIYCPVY